MKHPFIFSVPRSGLHLTAKVIGWPLYVNFDGMTNMEFVKNRILQKNKEILFTHQGGFHLGDTIDFILENTKSVLVVRDPKDVLLSWFFLYTKGTDYSVIKNMSDAIRGFIMSPFMEYPNKIILWKEHLNYYKQYLNTLLVIRYENLINNYAVESSRLSEHINLPVSDTLPSLEKVEMSRRGKIGDHKNYFSEQLIRVVDELCKEEIEFIDKYLI